VTPSCYSGIFWQISNSFNKAQVSETAVYNALKWQHSVSHLSLDQWRWLSSGMLHYVCLIDMNWHFTTALLPPLSGWWCRQ
jgi:hypothetical protein